MNIRRYLGKPWVRFGRGPDSFDCWGLVRHFYKEEHSIELPLHIIAPEKLAAVVRTMRESLLNDWLPIDGPQDNCLVVMSSKKQPHHVGICVSSSEELVLHCANGQGTCCQNLGHIKNLMAIEKVSYYLPKQWPSSS